MSWKSCDDSGKTPTHLLFDKRIWTMKDVALVTGYSIGTLYNLTSKGLIPHRKKRGKLYFMPTEIQNWIEEGDVE